MAGMQLCSCPQISPLTAWAPELHPHGGAQRLCEQDQPADPHIPLCPGTGLRSPHPYAEQNHLQQQIVTFKVLIGCLSNLALIIHTHTNTKTYSHLFQGLRSLFFFFNAI